MVCGGGAPSYCMASTDGGRQHGARIAVDLTGPPDSQPEAWNYRPSLLGAKQSSLEPRRRTLVACERLAFSSEGGRIGHS